jgi:ribosomal protein L11 methyltransferase
VATEIDPLAATIARDNARLNATAARVAVRMMPAMPARLPARQTGFDLVVANILLAPLLTLAPAITRALAPGGTAILSGLLPDQRIAIVATYRSLGLRLRRWFVLDGWLVVVLERPKRSARRQRLADSATCACAWSCRSRSYGHYDGISAQAPSRSSDSRQRDEFLQARRGQSR